MESSASSNFNIWERYSKNFWDTDTLDIKEENGKSQIIYQHLERLPTSEMLAQITRIIGDSFKMDLLVSDQQISNALKHSNTFKRKHCKSAILKNPS